MKKTVIGIIIGALIVFTIDVAAEAVISSGAVSYSNTTVSAALDELFSAVDINNKIGTTDISNIGDGTITGAISTLNSNVSDMKIYHRTYSVTLNSNASVTPYTYYNVFVIPASDVYTYGYPIAVYGRHSSGQPVSIYVDVHSSGGYACYIAGSASSVTLSAYFVKLPG